MHTIRMFLTFVLVGAPLGGTAAAFIAPPLVTMPYSPPGQGAGAALCNCKELTDNVVSALYQAQIVGLIAGAVLGAVLYIMLRRSGRLKKKPKAAETPAVAQEAAEAVETAAEAETTPETTPES